MLNVNEIDCRLLTTLDLALQDREEHLRLLGFAADDELMIDLENAKRFLDKMFTARYVS